jgi:hypothetical protein
VKRNTCVIGGKVRRKEATRKTKDNTETEVGQTEWDGKDWTVEAEGQSRWRAGKFLSGCTVGGLSSSPPLHRVN